MSERNYNDDVSINPDALDVEWTKQAHTFFKYAELLAAAKKKVNRLEQLMKVIRSQLLMEARAAGAKNASQEEAYYRTQPRHQEAKKEWIDAQYEADILDAAVFALHQKKAALENLVRLQGQNYFAGPSVPRDVGKEWVKEIERTGARDKVKEKMGAGRNIKR